AAWRGTGGVRARFVASVLPGGVGKRTGGRRAAEAAIPPSLVATTTPSGTGSSRTRPAPSPAHREPPPCSVVRMPRRSPGERTGRRTPHPRDRPSMNLTGIHPVTAVTANVREHYRLYTRVLGMRLVKRSVHQDDVSAYHL